MTSWPTKPSIKSEPWYRFLAGTTAPQVEFIGRILQYDPLPTLRAVGQPLLSVFGGQDLLVDVEESVGIIHRERERCERDLVVIFPDADHSIRTYTGTGSPKIRDGHYHPGAPAPGVVELIGTWINEHAR